MQRECPCKGCVPPNRSPKCHIECEYYLTWQKEHMKDKEVERTYLEFMNDVLSTYIKRRS